MKELDPNIPVVGGNGKPRMELLIVLKEMLKKIRELEARIEALEP